jgi:hypothetical protein
VFAEIIAQRNRRSLIEEDAHRSGNCQTFFRESKHGEHLLASHAWKPLEKLIHGRARFQIFKKGFYRYPRVFESPSAAQRVSGTLHRRACTPIYHATKLPVRSPRCNLHVSRFAFASFAQSAATPRRSLSEGGSLLRNFHFFWNFAPEIPEKDGERK